MARPLLSFFSLFAAVLAVSFFTILQLCNLLFTCGCTATSTDRCNIQQDVMAKCPWCAHGSGAFATVYGLMMIIAAAAIILTLKWTRGRLTVAFLAGLLVYWFIGSAAGLAAALFYHYPTLYGLKI